MSEGEKHNVEGMKPRGGEGTMVERKGGMRMRREEGMQRRSVE